MTDELECERIPSHSDIESAKYCHGVGQRWRHGPVYGAVSRIAPGTCENDRPKTVWLSYKRTRNCCRQLMGIMNYLGPLYPETWKERESSFLPICLVTQWMIYRIASITTDMHHYGFCVGRKAGGVGYKATTNLGHVDGGNGGEGKKQGKLATQNSKTWGNSTLS